MPIEPPPTRWRLPDPANAPLGQEIIGVGGDLAPGTLLAGYRSGMFAMPEGDLLGWWSPDPRGLLRPAAFHASRSLHRSLRRFTVSLDRDLPAVVAGCADPQRPHGWISTEYRQSYESLHALGWAHSVEVWDADGDLVGGLFGVEIGGLFAAESKFHVRSDASKVAVAVLAGLLAADHDPRRMIDVQWSTPHLARLGAHVVPRADYLHDLHAALACPGLFGREPVPAYGAGLLTRIRWRND